MELIRADKLKEYSENLPIKDSFSFSYLLYKATFFLGYRTFCLLKDDLIPTFKPTTDEGFWEWEVKENEKSYDFTFSHLYLLTNYEDYDDIERQLQGIIYLIAFKSLVSSNRFVNIVMRVGKEEQTFILSILKELGYNLDFIGRNTYRVSW